jgi:hypothetical protein
MWFELRSVRPRATEGTALVDYGGGGLHTVLTWRGLVGAEV